MDDDDVPLILTWDEAGSGLLGDEALEESEYKPLYTCALFTFCPRLFNTAGPLDCSLKLDHLGS